MALQAEEIISSKAKERQLSTLKQFSDSASLPGREYGETRDELASMSGVSARNISKVKNILDSVCEELVDQVRSSKISINAAELNENQVSIVSFSTI